MKGFNLTKNLSFYVNKFQCNWDEVNLTFIPTISFYMFRPDEVGVSGHYELIFQWLNFAAEFLYIKTYKVDNEELHVKNSEY